MKKYITLNNFFLLVNGCLILLFFVLVHKNTINIPFYDDFDSIGEFIINFKKSDFFNKISLLFSQYAEHRIVFTRLVALCYVSLFSTINFQALIIIGMLGLIGILHIFYEILPKQNRKPFLFFPIVLLLFNFQYYENLMMAMASLQNNFAPYFIFLFIYFLSFHQNTKYINLIFLFGFLSIFTSGNGLIVVPLGIIYFTIINRNFQKLLVWCAFSGILIFIYFKNYQTPDSSLGGRTSMLTIFSNPVLIFEKIALFMSASFHPIVGEKNIIYLILGVTLLIISLITCVFILKKSKTSFDIFLLLSLLFLLGTCYIVANTRNDMHISRYRIYSSLFLIIFYLAGLTYLPKFKKVLIGGYIIFAIYFSVNTISWYSTLFYQKANLEAGAISYFLNNGKWLGLYPPNTSQFVNEQNASETTNKLLNADLIQLPKELNINKKELLDLIKESEKCDGLEFSNKNFEHYVELKSDNFINNSLNYGMLKSENSIIFVPLVAKFKINLVSSFLQNEPIYNDGFNIIINKFNFKAGNYKFYIYNKTENKTKVCYLTDVNL